MAVDTTIQFNGHNSYKVTELLLAYPFGVQGMTYITHSFQVYCNSPLASATRAKTKFFDADGATLSEVSHAFAVPAVFEKTEITVPVPATAVQAQLVFLHGGTDWWFAEPKSEEGQTATPYNVNYAGQLTYITPNGIYTGMVTANQIVVTGSTAQPDETLETRLVTINNNAINLSATVSGQGSRLTLIEAGQITISGSATYAAGYDPTTKETPAGAQAKVNALAATLGDLAYEDLVEAAKLGTTVIVGGYIKTGLVSASNINVGTLSADRIAAKAITGAKMADGTVTGVQIAASAITAAKIAAGTITGDKIKAGTITADKIDVTNLAVGKITNLDDANNYVVLVDSISGQDLTFYSAIAGYSPAKRGQIQTLGSTAFSINAPVKTDTAGSADGVSILAFYHGDANIMISDSSKLGACRLQVGDRQLGVDKTGFFKSTDNGSTKTYF